MSSDFWADEIQLLKHDPTARLSLALEYRPYPAAYREAAIALRALIRDARKNGNDAEDLLRQLHRLGMEHAFLHDREYDEEIGPTHNIAVRIPQRELDELSFPYESFGYDWAPLFAKTDGKWFEEAWGPAESHRRPRDAYGGRWESFVSQYKSDNQKFEENVLRFAELTDYARERKKTSRVGCLAVLALPVALAIAACDPAGSGFSELDTVCVAFEDAYVIAQGDTVTEEQSREWFDRADAICEATASHPDPELPEDA
jgi:hypothetical protein